MKFEVELEDSIYYRYKELIQDRRGMSIEDLISSVMTQLIISAATQPEILAKMHQQNLGVPGYENLLDRVCNRPLGGTT